jgi:hypothetical protein
MVDSTRQSVTRRGCEQGRIGHSGGSLALKVGI